MLSIRKPIWPMSSPRSSTAIPCAVSTNSCPSPTSSPSPKGPWPDNDAYGDPLHLAAGGGGHKPQHQCVHPVGVSLGICQAEGGAPGQTQNGPTIDAVHLT